MFELLQYEFMRNALIASILASLVCGIIGTFIVLRKIVFISDGIAHSAFGGVGLGYFLHISPTIMAIPFSIFSAISINLLLNKKAKIEEDSAIGIMLVFGMAIGILFIYLTPGYAPDLMIYLFGSIISIPNFDLFVMCILDVIIIATIFLFYREFVYMCFDEEFSNIVGIKTKTLNLLLLCLIALSIVVLMRVVGIILLVALLTIPTTISKNFFKNVKSIILLSIFLATMLTVSGLFFSYNLNLPSGATIVLTSIIALIVAKIYKFLIKPKINKNKIIER